MKTTFSDQLSNALVIDNAFPQRTAYDRESGLQKWEWYFGKILQGLAANPDMVKHPPSFIVLAAMGIVQAIDENAYEIRETETEPG